MFEITLDTFNNSKVFCKKCKKYDAKVDEKLFSFAPKLKEYKQYCNNCAVEEWSEYICFPKGRKTISLQDSFSNSFCKKLYYRRTN